ncbi:hypothetical protein FO519_007426 [Halicephalobus sp. NKZ332]|nr:hypothetical protein FO519_007426 [Halicephalobus sp. NKZ332]
MKAVFTSNVFYLKGYSRINGLSGTLGSIEESRTLKELYNTDLIKIPTFQAKKFYEHVPVIEKTEEEWLESIFEEVKNQIKAGRSVLVICQSIIEVNDVKKRLKQQYDYLQNPDNEIIDCFGNMIVYRREFDKFDFSGENKLQPRRLILATNLAGRGTDIKLSEELKEFGGLHVIVSFLPENCRIEDQAFGRAARCGDPGSGQIIALTDKTDSSGQASSVFELKIFRDNAEAQRIQSMTDYYNFHTKIEEECLTAFKEHCLVALNNMNNKKNKDSGILTEEEIIYFALLDEWASWLDSQASIIKQCARDRNEVQRTDIITSVENFLNTHPISPNNEALSWIKCPQPLLALGLVKIDEKKFDEATEIFDKIIINFPEFSGDACYYKGIISQKDVRKVKNLPTDIGKKAKWYTRLASKVGKKVDSLSQKTLTPLKEILPDNICEIDDVKRIETEDNLLLGVQSFNRRIEMKKELHTIVSKIHHAVCSRTTYSDGYKNQTEDTELTYDCLSTSAYDMMGHPVSFITFGGEKGTIDEKYEAQLKFLKYAREGYISPKMLNHKILPEQYDALKNKYMLSKTTLQKIFKEMIEDENKEKQEFYVMEKNIASEEIQELSTLYPIELPSPDPFRIQLSDFDLSQMILYDAEKVEKAFERKKEKLQWLESMEYLVKDASAIIDFETFKKIIFMPNFDYFTLDEIAEYLEITVEKANWVVKNLVKKLTFGKY